MPIAADKDVEKVPAKTICQSCGGEFFCGANVGACWCFAVALKPEIVADWRGKFENCLCEICLSEAEGRGSAEQK